MSEYRTPGKRRPGLIWFGLPCVVVTLALLIHRYDPPPRLGRFHPHVLVLQPKVKTVAPLELHYSLYVMSNLDGRAVFDTLKAEFSKTNGYDQQTILPINNGPNAEEVLSKTGNLEWIAMKPPIGRAMEEEGVTFMAGTEVETYLRAILDTTEHRHFGFSTKDTCLVLVARKPTFVDRVFGLLHLE